jgi:hypothetical protein
MPSIPERSVVMAEYRAKEVIERLNEIIKDGYDIVEITENEADDDFSEFLSFSVYDPVHECGIEYDFVDSIGNPD